jgi:hypothetical protein
MWGMRDCRLTPAVGHLGLSNYVDYQTLAGIRNHFSLVEFKPQLRGDLLLKVYEQQSLWLRGMSELCVQLVTLYKKISVIYVFV